MKQVEGYLLLEDRVRSLEKQVNDLRELLRLRLPKTPQNSSMPSGQSQKANKKDIPKAKRGPKAGHRGKSRARSEPDESVECRVAGCSHCSTDLSVLPQHVAGRHQVIDIPPLRPWCAKWCAMDGIVPGAGTIIGLSRRWALKRDER